MFDSSIPFKKRAFQKFSDHTYSQHGEDLMLMNFSHLLHLEKPSYLDIGAYHPEQINNTALLYENGSRGINIEANPILIPAFHKQRPEDYQLCAGVGLKKGNFPFYMENDYSVLNSFEKVHIETQNIKINKVIYLAMITLKDVITDYCNGKFPDILLMDIEGMDYEVLSSFDFSQTFPKIICAELSRTQTLELLQLKSFPFQSICRMVSNVIFVHESLAYTCNR